MESPFEKRLRFVVRNYRDNTFNPDTAWQKFLSSKKIQTRSLHRRYWASVAAVAALIILVSGVFVFRRESRSGYEDIYAQGVENLIFLLPDSTQITLAPEAHLRYNRRTYGRDKRDVTLQGKAFFEVRPNQDAPFIVAAANTSVTVLGTSFQVDQTDNGVAVDVVSGKVRFEAKDHTEKAILTAGMSADYSQEDHAITIAQEYSRNSLAWKTHTLIFRETPVNEVIRTLEAYYRVRIGSKNPIDSSLKLTATFEKMTLREVIPIINRTLDIRLIVEHEMPKNTKK